MNKFLRVVSRTLLIGALVSMIVPSASALAITSGGIGGRPANPDPNNARTQSIFIYSLDRGATKQDEVLVSNTTDEERTIVLYAVDGIVTNTGAFTCEQDAEARVGVGKWLTLSEKEVTLGPRQEARVGMNIVLPTDADVGEHNGCVVFENKDADTVPQGNVRIKTRQALRVVVTVPGDLKKEVTVSQFGIAPLTDVDNRRVDGRTYTLTLKNTGNVSADVDAKVRLKSLFGTIVYENGKAANNTGDSYPVLGGHELNLTFDDTTRPFFGGWYKAQATISYDKRPGVFGTSDAAQLITKTSDEVTVFIAPSMGAVLLFAVIVLLIAGLLVRNYLRRREVAVWHTYKIQSGDTIEKVAKHHGVKWQKLASINGLKAPYTLHTGKTLRVPGKK